MFTPTSLRSIARSTRPSTLPRAAVAASRIATPNVVRAYSDKAAEEAKPKEGEAAAANGDAEKVKGLEEKIKSLEVSLGSFVMSQSFLRIAVFKALNTSWD